MACRRRRLSILHFHEPSPTFRAFYRDAGTRPDGAIVCTTKFPAFQTHAFYAIYLN